MIRLRAALANFRDHFHFLDLPKPTDECGSQRAYGDWPHVPGGSVGFHAPDYPAGTARVATGKSDTFSGGLK